MKSWELQALTQWRDAESKGRLLMFRLELQESTWEFTKNAKPHMVKKMMEITEDAIISLSLSLSLVGLMMIWP
jgi:hypothetical protein